MGDLTVFVKQNNVEVFTCSEADKYPSFLLEVLKESSDTAAYINVYEIVSWSADEHMMPSACELYLHAYIKQDSCSHFYFGEEEDLDNGSNVSGYLHLCGATCIKKHFDIMRRVYNKAFEIMGKEPLANEKLD